MDRFEAVLEKGERSLGWTIARVPPGLVEGWKERVRLRVCGTISGPGGDFAFRTSLFPSERGGFYLLVTRAMQEGAGVGLGSVAAFQLEPDLRPREAELPEELAVLLDQEEELRTWYDRQTEYMRREIGKWIVSVKSDAARLRRAEQMAERILGTMEAERELPPVIAAAFRERPKAKAGWARMTELQRRNELFAVMYYQGVEARLKRVQGLCDVAERH